MERKRDRQEERPKRRETDIGKANEKEYGQKERKIGRDTCRERGQEESGKEERETERKRG